MRSSQQRINLSNARIMKCISVWIVLIAASISSNTTGVEGKPMHQESHLLREQGTHHNQRNTAQPINNRGLQSESSGDPDLDKHEFPQRVRIDPFHLLLAPTPIQLQRADEDALLVELQELLSIFMKIQFGEDSQVERMGTATSLEYVLFSDIEQNSWSQGKKNDPAEPPRTVLKFNGGIASFLGPNSPTEDEVNEWVESAIDGLFAKALEETPYEYMEVTQYMSIDEHGTNVQSGDVVVNMASVGWHNPGSSQAVSSQTASSHTAQTLETNSSAPTDGRRSLIYILSSALCVIVVAAAMLSLRIRSNNRAVRILCLSDKDKEEVVDFEQGSISIKHETPDYKDSDEYADFHSNDDFADEDYDQFALKKDSLVRVDDDLQSQISVAGRSAIEEASQQSEPTMSALSFSSPNPFSTNSFVSQESFQNERKTYLSKDMMYSSWSGQPNFNAARGKRPNESVLAPSYFSAEKELIARAKKMLSLGDSDHDKKDPAGFRFEQAHENGEGKNNRGTDDLNLDPTPSNLV